jgi:hypothetical protein
MRGRKNASARAFLCGYLSALDHIPPIGVTANLRPKERAERDDFPTANARGIYGMLGQRLTDALSPKCIIHLGMVDDDQMRARPRKRHFRRMAGKLCAIAPTGRSFFEADLHDVASNLQQLSKLM